MLDKNTTNLMRRVVLPTIIAVIACFDALFIGLSSAMWDVNVSDMAAEAGSQIVKPSTISYHATINGLGTSGKGEYKMSNHTFSLSTNTTKAYWYEGNGTEGHDDMGNGIFGADTGGTVRQDKQQKVYFTYVRVVVDDAMREAAAQGKLKFNCSGTYGSNDTYKQLIGAGVFFLTSLPTDVTLYTFTEDLDGVGENTTVDNAFFKVGTKRWTSGAKYFSDKTTKTFSGSATLSTSDLPSTSTFYIAIGVTSMCQYDGVLGFMGGRLATGYVKNVTCTFTYADARDITLTCGSNGKLKYTTYNPTSYSAAGSPTTVTLSAGSSATIHLSTPFTFVKVEPIEDATAHPNYRLDYYKIGGTKQYFGYGSASSTPTTNTVPAVIFATGSDKPGSYGITCNTNTVNTTAKICETYYTKRSYKIHYYTDEGNVIGGTNKYKDVEYKYDANNTVPQVGSIFTNGTQKGISWTYGSDVYLPDTSLGNPKTPITDNTTVLNFKANWVKASGTVDSPSDEFKLNGNPSPETYELYEDVIFTFSVNKTGHTLVGVYGTYTSGDLNGETIALEKKSNTQWILYGICGDVSFTPEWRANTYKITYTVGTGTISSTSYPTFYEYGVGISSNQLPTVTANDGYVFLGWSTSTAAAGIVTTSAVFTNTAENKTLTAIYTSATPPQTYSSTTSMTALTDVSGALTVNNYKKGGQNVQRATSQGTLTGSWGVITKHTYYYTPTNCLYWLYFSNCDTNPSGGVSDTNSSQPSGDDTELNGYAHYYVALTGDALKAYRSGQTVSVQAYVYYYVTCFKSGSAKKNASAQMKLGIGQGFTTSTTVNHEKDGTRKTTSSSNAFQSANGGITTDTLDLSNSSSSVPGFTIQLHAYQTCTKGSTAEYISFACVTQVQYKITYGSKVEKTIILNGNGGSFTPSGGSAMTSFDAAKGYVANSSTALTITAPSSPFTRAGYEFLGWSTSNTATSASIAVGGTLTTESSSSQKYYAVWRAKKYPLITYDIWTDGSENYATSIRKEYYVEHGSTGSKLNKAMTTTNSNSSGNSVVYAGAGGDDYGGFTISKTGTITKATSFSSYSYDFKRNRGANGTEENGTTFGTISGPTYGYFIWNMNAPTIAVKENAVTSVDYGHGIKLDDLVQGTHGASRATLTYRYQKSGGSGNYVFYMPDTDEEHKHTIYAVSESGDYAAFATASVTKGKTGSVATLTKETPSGSAATVTVTIRPLRTVIYNTKGNAVYAYTGEAQGYPLGTQLDSTYYPNTEEYNYLDSVFCREQSTTTGEMGRPWYYSDAGRNEYSESSAWTSGLKVSLVGLSFDPYIGTEAAFPKTIVGGQTAFRDAGDYYVSEIQLNKLSPSGGSSGYNTNYVWKYYASGTPQRFTAASANADGTIKATIEPAGGFDIYAFYTAKYFGSSLSDPTKVIFDIEGVNGIPAILNTENYYNSWYIGIDGLKGDINTAGSDAEVAQNILQSYLKREKPTMSEKAGRYNVYLDLSEVVDTAHWTLAQLSTETNNNAAKRVISFRRLLNNYGVKYSGGLNIASGNDTVAMYWVMSKELDGSEYEKTGPFYFKQATPSMAHDNYEIIARTISLSVDNPNRTYNYSGTAQGHLEIVADDLVSNNINSAEGNYDNMFTLYLMGIALPQSQKGNDNWAAYIASYKGEEHASAWHKLGDTGNDSIYDAQHRTVHMTAIDAGSYAVAIMGVGYKQGSNYVYNPNFILAEPKVVTWTIKQATITATASTTSDIFGDKNYGGMKLTFGGLVNGEVAHINSYSLKYDGSAASSVQTNYYRYVDFTTATDITNNVIFSAYGSYAGSYEMILSGVTAPTHDSGVGMYATAGDGERGYGRHNQNYLLTAANVASAIITISARTLSYDAWAYTVDNKATYNTTKPADSYWVYAYGVAKGAKIRLYNFYASDFKTADITISNSSSGFVNSNLTADLLVQGSYLMINGTREPATLNRDTDVGNNELTYIYTAVNAGTYGAYFSGMKYKRNGVDYPNYALPTSITGVENRMSFTIGKKALTLVWDVNAPTPTAYGDKFGIYYDTVLHTVTAALQINGDNANVAGKVYKGDETSVSVSVNQAGSKGQNVGAYTATAVLGGAAASNYSLSNGTKNWSISRRKFSISVASSGQIYEYDGTEKGKTVNLVADSTVDGKTVDVAGSVNISDVFGLSGSNFRKSSGLELRGSTSSFVATDSAKYTVYYDAGTGINIDDNNGNGNWTLTGSLDLETGGKFLFAIIPEVITLQYTVISRQYNGTNRIAEFKPTYQGDLLLPTGLTYTYNLTEIIHAGSHTLTVTGINYPDAKRNFVLANVAGGNWYNDLGTGNATLTAKYTDATTIAGYTASVNITQKPISPDPSWDAVVAALPDFTYDGGNHGIDLGTIYNTYFKAQLFAADRDYYTLDGSSDTGKDVGEYNVSFTGFRRTDSATYIDYIFLDNAPFGPTWNIVPRVLSITYSAYHEAGAAAQFVYDKKEHGYTLELNGLVAGESLALCFSDAINLNVTSPVTLSNNDAVVGSNTVVLKGTAAQSYSIGGFSIADSGSFKASNYSWGDVSSSVYNKSWTIARLAIAVEWHNTNLIYRAREYDLTTGGVYATVTNTVSGDALGLTYEGNTATDVRATPYRARITGLTGADLSNYRIEGSLETDWTISPKPITAVVWTGDARFTGYNVIYDYASHSVTATAVATKAYGSSAADDADGEAYTGDTVTFTYENTSPYVVSASIKNDYQTKIKASVNPNYTVNTELKQEWHILPRTLTAAIANDGASYTYNGGEQGVTLTIDNIVADDYNNGNLTIVTTGSATGKTASFASGRYTREFKNIDKGAYTVSVAIGGTRAGCYELAGVTSGGFAIEQRTVTLTWAIRNHAGLSVEYDGTTKTVVATVSNLAKASDEVTVNVTNGEKINVGDYTATASSLSGANSANYKLPDTLPTRGYSITPREISCRWTTTDAFDYNGTYRSNSLTVSRMVATDSVKFKVVFRKNNASGAVVGTAEIAKSGAASYVLTAADFAMTVDAGTYYAVAESTVYKADGTIDGNYAFADSNSVYDNGYGITPATLSLTGKWYYAYGAAAKQEYTSGTTLIYKKQNYILTTEIDTDSIFDRLGVADSLGLAYSGNEKSAYGTYTAEVSAITGEHKDNYVLPVAGTRFIFDIHKKPIDLVWSNYEDKIYSGANVVVTASVTTGATADDDYKVYTGDTVTVSCSNATKKNAGSHTSTATINNVNYVVRNGGTLNWSIAPLPVSLHWSSSVEEYDGTTKTVTAEVINLVPGDQLILSYSNNSFINKGDYVAEVTGLGGANSTDYTLTGVVTTHDWKITPIILGLAWTGMSGLVYNGSAQGPTLTVTKIADEDLGILANLSFNLTLSPAAPAQNVTITTNESVKVTAVNAGTYNVTAISLTGTAAAAGNYELPDGNNTVSFTIGQLPVVAEWTTDVGDLTYKAADYTVAAKAVEPGKVGSDVINFTYKTDGVANTASAIHAGDHTTVITGVDNTNYTVVGGVNLTLDWNIKQKSISAVSFKIDGVATDSVGYDNAAKTITATVTDGASSADDGKKYTGDTISFNYATAVTADYGLSALDKTANTVLNAGAYKTTVTSANTDYKVDSGVKFEFTVTKRTITASVTPASTDYEYTGSKQGVTLTFGNIVAADNTATQLYMNTANTGSPLKGEFTVSSRSGSSLVYTYKGTNADMYSVTPEPAGTRSANYTMSSLTAAFEIRRKDITTRITANVSTDKVIYAARNLTADDLDITFNNLITGEELSLSADFEVSYKQGGTAMASAPINVGNYTACIALKSGSVRAGNYQLTGTTEFDFTVAPYVLKPEDLIFELNGSAVNPKQDLVYAEDAERNPLHKNLTARTTDEVFNTLGGKTFSYQFFGFCTCGFRESSASALDAEHLSHQWLLDGGAFRTTGPAHAGNYYMIITLSGGDSENFKLEDFDTYSNSRYFKTIGSETYLYWSDSNEKAIDIALPTLGDNVVAYIFGINRLTVGANITEPTNSTVPFRGTAYTATAGGGLPMISEVGSDSGNIVVTINGTNYTRAEYESLTTIRNAGTYNIRIFDSANEGLVASGCDLFNSGATTDYSWALTITKSKITVTDTSAAAWSKVYDKTASYTGFSYATGVTYVAGVETDGIISGTTLTITCVFDGVNVGHANRDLIFTLSGADKGNYYLVFRSPKEGVAAPSSADDYNYLVKDTHYTVSADGTVYNIQSAASITPKPITVTGNTDKPYDGTTALTGFTVTSSDICAGDTVTVTGTYDDENVGTDKPITITSDNPNYTISTTIAATGTISPKQLTVTWTDKGITPVYDGNTHGISVTISGMIAGHEEDISVTGNNITATTISGTSPTVGFSGIAAKTYVVNLTLGSDSNYYIADADASADWTIRQLEVVLAWDRDTLSGANIASWDGYTVEYSAVERSVTPRITNIVTGDIGKLGCTVINNTRTAVGTDIEAEVTDLTGEASGNYKLPADTTQKWSITLATITGVTLPSYIGADAFVYDNSPKGTEVSTGVTQHGIAFHVTYATDSADKQKTAPTIVGNNAVLHATIETEDYDPDNIVLLTVTVTATITCTNYETKILTASIQVVPAEITSITLTNKSVRYNGAEQEIKVNKTVTNYDETLSVTYSVNGGASVGEVKRKDVGTYNIVATVGADNYDYYYKELAATFTITKADIDPTRITVTLDSGTRTYDTMSHGITITVTDNKTQYGDPVTITYYGGESNGRATNVGVYHINAVISAGSNYNDYTTEASTLNIIAKEVTVNYANNDFTYNAATQEISVTYTSGATANDDGKIYTADAADFEVTVEYLGTSGAADGSTTFKNAGDYTVTVSFNNTNYIPSDPTAYYEMKQYDISSLGFYFVGNEVTYNGTSRYISINTTDTAYTAGLRESVNLLGTDLGVVSYKYNTTGVEPYTTEFKGLTNAGVYYIKATIEGATACAGNYIATDKYATLTINRSKLDSFGIEDSTVIYNGRPHEITIQVNNASQIIDGKYYSLHGDEVHVAYKINDGSGEVSGNSATDVNLDGEGNVTYYTVTAYLTFDEAVAPNYYDNITRTARLKIEQYDLGDIELVGETCDYDGAQHGVTLNLPETPAGSTYPVFSLNAAQTQFTVTLTDGHTGDTFTVTYEIKLNGATVTEMKNIGEYTVTATLSENGNYVAIAPLTATVNINPARIDDTNIYFQGDNIVYCSDRHYLKLATTEADSGFTHNVSDVINSLGIHPVGKTADIDTATVTYSCDDATFEGAINHGTYIVTATISHPNYINTTKTATLVIAKADINYYFVGNSDPVVYSMSKHYVAVSDTNAFSDTKPAVTIPLAGTDRATVTYTLVSDDSEFDGATNVGTYVVKATLTLNGGDISANYEPWEGSDFYKTATLVITPYDSTVTWTWRGDRNNYVYNGAVRDVVTAKYRKPDGTTEETDFTILGVSGKATGDDEIKNAGNYTLTVEIDNYSFTNGTNIEHVEIKKANIERHFTGDTIGYSATTKYLLLNTTAAANVSDTLVDTLTVYGETINVDYTYTKGSDGKDSYYDGSSEVILNVGARNAGIYTVTANINLGAGESNFNAWTEAKTATLMITKLTLTPSSARVSKVYDGTTAANCEINGVHDDNKAYISFVATYDDKNVGTGKTVNVTTVAKPNYEYLEGNYNIPSITDGEIEAKELHMVYPEGTTAFKYWQIAYFGGTDRPQIDATAANGVVVIDGVTEVVKINPRYNSKNVAEANKVFLTLTGKDSGNYVIEDLDFTDQITDSEKLIKPLVSTLEWNTTVLNTIYNGVDRTASVTAKLLVVGEEDSKYAGGDGKISLPLELYKTKNGAGETLSPELSTGVSYRDAGTYRAEINESALDTLGLDANIFINYAISDASKQKIGVIERETLTVVWAPADSTGLVYNGEIKLVTASVTLLGTDVGAYSDYLMLTCLGTSDGATGKTEFKFAGDYEFAVAFKTDEEFAALVNNYILENDEQEYRIEKAPVDNILFEYENAETGNKFKQTYYSGETHYFFVVAADSGITFSHTTTEPASVTKFKYRYDTDEEIEISYNGGDTDSTLGLGWNGVRKVKFDASVESKPVIDYTIVASVPATDNYLAWSKSITVRIERGTIDNIALPAVEAMTYEYNGKQRNVYGYNTPTEGPIDPEQSRQLKLPDGNIPKVEYDLAVLNYCIDDLELDYKMSGDDVFATNAGVYLVQMTVTDDNYEQLVLNSSIIITQCESGVLWTYKNNSPTPDYYYNATNQLDTVGAYVLLVEEGADRRYLTIGARLQDSYLNFIDTLSWSRAGLSDEEKTQMKDTLRSMFLLTGKYDFTATPEKGASESDIDYNLFLNNYKLTNDELKEAEAVEMHQYTVDIVWYYGATDDVSDYPEIVPAGFDPSNPVYILEPVSYHFIYDGTGHGIRAKGKDFNDRYMSIDVSGDISGKINAGDYIATVDRISGGFEAVTVGSETYHIPYDINYTLAHSKLEWAVEQREISIVYGNSNLLSKVYDGKTEFSSKTLTKGFSAPEAGQKGGKKTYTYTFEEQPAVGSNVFSYTLTNIIPSDKNNIDLLVQSLDANVPHVTAEYVTVKFDNLVVLGDIKNYKISSGVESYVYKPDEISAAGRDVPNVITQAELDIRLAEIEYVYNGDALHKEFILEDEIDRNSLDAAKYLGKTLFTFNRTGDINSVVTGLVEGNYLEGIIDIGGNANSNVGYIMSGTDIEVYYYIEGAERKDMPKNYKLTVYDGTCDIVPRRLQVEYSHVLQSRKSLTDVEGSIDLSESETADLIIPGGQTAAQALATLTGGLSLNIDNSWRTTTFTQYTYVTAGLSATVGDSNFTINQPYLQVTYLGLHAGVDEYKFDIDNLDDLAHLSGDVSGLAARRDSDGIGDLPEYYLTADISGINMGGYGILRAIKDFRGVLYGNNHTVSGFNIISDGNTAGFFTAITEGGVNDLKLLDIHVYGGRTVGILAGEITDGVTVGNITVQGSIPVKVTDSSAIYAGGLAGKITRATVSDIDAVLKMRIESGIGVLYVGGLVGYADGGSYSGVTVFDDLSVYTSATEKYLGNLIGYATGDYAVNNAGYLAYGLYIAGDSVTDAVCGNATVTASGFSYDDFVSDGEIGGVITGYVVRGFQLPSGAEGTATKPVLISNYRQLALTYAYPYMTFRITANIYSPVLTGSYDRGFSGTITVDEGKAVQAPVPTNTTYLFAAVRANQNVLIGKRS